MDRVDESEGSKAIALKAIRGVFIERDARVVQELFAPDYIQHNPTIPNGRDAIAGLLGSVTDRQLAVDIVQLGWFFAAPV